MCLLMYNDFFFLTTLNNVDSKTLFNAVFNSPQQVVWFWLCNLGSTILFNVVDNQEQCRSNNIVVSCFQQPLTTCNSLRSKTIVTILTQTIWHHCFHHYHFFSWLLQISSKCFKTTNFDRLHRKRTERLRLSFELRMFPLCFNLNFKVDWHIAQTCLLLKYLY